MRREDLDTLNIDYSIEDFCKKRGTEIWSSTWRVGCVGSRREFFEIEEITACLYTDGDDIVEREKNGNKKNPRKFLE